MQKFIILVKIISEIKYLVPGRPVNVSLESQKNLCMYCYRGMDKHLIHMWQTTYVSFSRSLFICFNFLNRL